MQLPGHLLEKLARRPAFPQELALYCSRIALSASGAMFGWNRWSPIASFALSLIAVCSAAVTAHASLSETCGSSMRVPGADAAAGLAVHPRCALHARVRLAHNTEKPAREDNWHQTCPTTQEMLPLVLLGVLVQASPLPDVDLRPSQCCVQMSHCDPSLAAVLSFQTDRALLDRRWGAAAHGSLLSATVRRGLPFSRAAGNTPTEKWVVWYHQLLDPVQSNASLGYRQVRRYMEHTGLSCLHKLQHDREQLTHLMKLRKLPLEFRQLQQRLVEAEAWAKRKVGDSLSRTIKLPLQLREHLKYNRLVHLEPALSTVPARAIRWRSDWKLLEDLYLAATPQVRIQLSYCVNGACAQVMVLDQLLSQEALGRLRRFCLESTVSRSLPAPSMNRAWVQIWYDVKPEGYLGAYWDDGFATPLLFQIADELHTALPRIFKSLPLVCSVQPPAVCHKLDVAGSSMGI